VYDLVPVPSRVYHLASLNETIRYLSKSRVKILLPSIHVGMSKRVFLNVRTYWSTIKKSSMSLILLTVGRKSVINV